MYYYALPIISLLYFIWCLQNSNNSLTLPTLAADLPYQFHSIKSFSAIQYEYEALSPGGLLLPYHLGALASLSYHNYLNESTPLAGSSAGAIAVASQASGVNEIKALEASIRVSNKCSPLFVASGGLLPALQHELNRMLSPEAHQILNDRKGTVALAYREVFPKQQAVYQKKALSDTPFV